MDIPEIRYDEYIKKAEDFYGMVSRPDYVSTTNTPQLRGLLAGINIEVSLVVELLNRFELLKLHLGVDIRAINDHINDVALGHLGSCRMIHDPIPAHNHLTQLLYALNRKERLERIRVELDIHISLLKDLHGLCLGKILSLENILRLSIKIDIKIGLCSGGGGLLGLGGLLDPLLCTRGGILGGLLDPVIRIVADLVVSLKLKIDLFKHSVGKNLGYGHIGRISDVTSYDYADDALRNHIFECYGQLENKDCPSYGQVKERFGRILNDHNLLSRVYALFHLQLNPFKCANPYMTCSFEDNIRCSFTGTISVGVFVGLELDVLGIDLSIRAGIDISLHLFRILFLGLTGCPHAHVGIKSFDEISGRFELELNVHPDVHESMCKPYRQFDLQDSSIYPKVTQYADEVKNYISGYESPSDYITAIDEKELQMKQRREEYGSAPYQVEDVLYDISNKDYTDRENAQTAIYDADNTLNCAQIVKDRVIGYESNEIDAMEARLKNFKYAVIQSNEYVDYCTKELIQAELDRVNRPGDDRYIQAHERRHEALCGALEQAIRIKEQHSLISIQLDALILSRRDALIALELDLSISIQNLQARIEIGVSHLRIELLAKLNVFHLDLLKIFLAIRPGCSILNPEGIFLNLEILDAVDIRLKIKILDILGEGESYDHMRGCHRNMIHGALGALLRILHIGVSDGGGDTHKKRGETDEYECEYDVVIGGTQQQEKRGNSGQQIEIDVIPDATTSSASSLAFSFIMLFAIVSFVFFK